MKFKIAYERQLPMKNGPMKLPMNEIKGLHSSQLVIYAESTTNLALIKPVNGPWVGENQFKVD